LIKSWTLFLAVLFFAISAAGQTGPAKPPELWGHWIGETIPEFFAAEGMTPEAYCAKRAVPGSGKHKVYPCSWPKGASKGSVTPEMTVSFGEILYMPMEPYVPSRWAVFKAGRVAEIDATVDNFDGAVADLMAKFGKPTMLKYATLENGFGATWKTGTAVWLLGDIAITVIQHPELGTYRADVSMTKKPPVRQPHNIFEK
jgi:hypothetical protein